MFHGHMLSVTLTKELLERLTKKNCKKQITNNCKKTNKKEFIFEMVIERKGDKLYVKWKSCYSSFNSWIDENYII